MTERRPTDVFVERNPIKHLVVEKVAALCARELHIKDPYLMGSFQDSLSRGKPGIIVGNHLSDADGPMTYHAMSGFGYGDLANDSVGILGINLEIEGKRKTFIDSYSHIRVWPPTLEPSNEEETKKMMAMNKSAARAARDQLKSCKPLLLYPEGTRSRTNSLNMVDPRVGHYLFMAPDTQILLWAMTGTEDIWPIGNHLPKRGDVKVKLGLLSVDEVSREFEGMSQHEKRGLVMDRVMCELALLLPESYRGHYAESAGKYQANKSNVLGMTGQFESQSAF